MSTPNTDAIPEQDIAAGFQTYQAGGVTVVDVREPDEWAAGHIPGAIHVPLMTLPDAVASLPAGPLLIVCHLGGRSLRATRYLHSVGRTEAINLNGGLEEWAAAGHPVTRD